MASDIRIKIHADGNRAISTLRYVPDTDTEFYNTWGLEDRSVLWILSRLINGNPVQYNYKDATGVTCFDSTKSIALQEIAGRIASAFSEWLGAYIDLRTQTEALYNRMFSVFVPPVYDGSDVVYPDIS